MEKVNTRHNVYKFVPAKDGSTLIGGQLFVGIGKITDTNPAVEATKGDTKLLIKCKGTENEGSYISASTTESALKTEMIEIAKASGVLLADATEEGAEDTEEPEGGE